MEFIEIFPEERLEFKYSNPFQEQLGRLAEYQGTIIIPRKYYIAARKASLVTHNYHVGISRFKRVILESLPRANSIGLLDEVKLVIRSLGPQSHSINLPVVSLVHRQSSNYGHWLMDYLPRALAGLHYRQFIGSKLKILVPYHLAPWQLRSLQLIGLDQDAFIHVPPSSTLPFNLKLEVGIFSRSHSFHSVPHHGGKDALSPLVFRSIKNKIVSKISTSKNKSEAKKLFILRKSSGDLDRRFILNVDELRVLLEPYGFIFIYLEDLSFDQQVVLFSAASHVIAVHGSGLTNLMFSDGPHVLELFSSGHGIRPEYWQLTSMVGGHYAHIIVETKPPFHDMIIPLHMVKRYLEYSL